MSSVVLATTPESGAPVGSPTPSSYCELMSEFSTSPASLAAASPPDPSNANLKPARSRSTSVASEGEPVASTSPKTKPNIIVAKNMPFANLLTVSYTGVLFPLPEEIMGRKKSHSESAILEGNGNTEVPLRADSFANLMCAAVPGAANEEHKETKVSTEENVKVETEVTKGEEELKADDAEKPAVKVSFDLECSERTLVDPDSDSQTESRKDDVGDPEESVATLKRSTADAEEVVATSDDDSFVKIPLFGRTSAGEAAQEGELDTHLTEFVTSCKAAPPLIAVPQEWDTLSDIQSLVSASRVFFCFDISQTLLFLLS
ncbi:unnamed protein product [Cylicostephanus goldi]|uniref:Uncharacterized protein n=1 Tax=Cylicostephanus goldi TaxID=71465 RepID=A0A3P6QJJ3_CYLGO|nr:unnamed protein product [Cylicostephanus goldi]